MVTANNFSVPDFFNEYLDKCDAQSEQTKEENAQKQREVAAEEKREREEKKQEAKHNLKYAKAIFAWADKLRRSETWKRMWRNPTTGDTVPATVLHFFTWFEWFDDSDEGCRYKLFIVKEGIMWRNCREMYAGHEGFNTICKKPAALAGYMKGSEALLEDACHAIKSGKVWRWIKKDLKYI